MEHVMDLASEISESSSLVSEDMRTLDGSVDGEPRADGLYEERFRVDRRKLESMLLGEVVNQCRWLSFCHLLEKIVDVFAWLLPSFAIGNK